MEQLTALYQKINEARYLSTENTYRYRHILREFYHEYNKFNYWLYKEEIYEVLRLRSQFEEYTLEQCAQDLDQLRLWGNLNVVQDTSKATSIEEYKNKSFRYQLSEYAIEIERMTIKLENLGIEGGSLQPNLLEKIKRDLTKLHTFEEKSQEELGIWWDDLMANFKRLNQEYQDYIRDWQSIKAEEMMKTHSFLTVKDKFIEYLRNFVKNLQDHVHVIEEYLKVLEEEQEEYMIKMVIEYKKSIPRIEGDDFNLDELERVIRGRWLSVRNWFIGQPSEAEQLFEMTNDIIRKITRYATRLVEIANHSANRKEEYKKVSQLFASVPNKESMGKLSAIVFGVPSPKHLKGDIQRETESISRSVYDEKAYEYILKPRVRTFREKAQRQVMRNYSEEQEKVRAATIKKTQDEQRMIDALSKDGMVDFSQLEILTTTTRNTLLHWLSKGLTSKSGYGKTENGREYQILFPQSGQRCCLFCEDGEMEMPAFKIKFKGVQG